MKSAFKARWIQALLSGDYKQGRIVLRSIDNRFCCLGVACDLMDQSAWDMHNPRHFHCSSVTGVGWRGLEPQTVGDGLAEALGMDKIVMQELSVANDGGKSFAEIAGMIRDRVHADADALDPGFVKLRGDLNELAAARQLHALT